MGFIDSYVGEWNTIVLAQTSIPSPTPPAMNFFTSIQAMKKSIVEFVKNGRVSLPFCVICMGNFPDEPNMGIDTWAQKRVPTALYIVQQWGGTNGSQDWVMGQAQAVGIYIDNPSNGPFTYISQCQESCSIASDVTDDVNRALGAHSEVQVICAGVKWVPGFFVSLAGAS